MLEARFAYVVVVAVVAVVKVVNVVVVLVQGRRESAGRDEARQLFPLACT